jgi:hypothetical protein
MPVKYRILPEVSPQDAERFWSNVEIRGVDECWPWLAGKNPRRDNYGRFWIKRVEYRTNRMAYWLHYKVDPGPDDTCHTCDNPPCCNPAHLFKGTRAVNLADMRSKGRQAKGANHGLKLHPERAAHGEKLPQTKLNPDTIRAIRARHAQGGITQARLAAMFGIGQAHLWYIVHRKVWKHVH